jgi:hypothetical protein
MTSAPPDLRGLSIRAQQFITEHGSRWDTGFVLFYLGKPFGWARELGEPQRYSPGVYAVPVTTTGGFHIATGGEEGCGADHWVAL